ncbi:MAG: site-2 protease family protein [Actinomycetes bacterium]
MSDSDERGTLRIAGIPIVLPWSSLIGVGVLTWIFAPGFTDGSGKGGYVLAAIFAVLVYGTILLHELAHAGAARSFGFPVHQIRLYALGGYTAYERKVHTPGREFVIAVAGPAATLAIAAICWYGGRAFGAILEPGSIVTDMLLQLGWVGLVLGIYNLLPGIPLDGGALVKCPVWKISGSEALGTRVGAWSGIVVAIAVFLSPFAIARRLGQDSPDTVSVITVAIFAAWLGMGAYDALRRSKMQERLPGLDAGALARQAISVYRDLPLSEGLSRQVAAGASALIVVDSNGYPTAIANDDAVTAVPEERRPWVSVGSVSRSISPASTLLSSLTGEDLIDAMSDNPAPEYLVLDAVGAVVGVLTTGDVQAALTSP